MLKEHKELLSAGDESFVFWGRGRQAMDETEFRFASDVEVYADALATRFDGRAGFHSKNATCRLLSKLDEIQPDVVHLHNLHGYYVNVELLFAWLVRHESVRVEWTLHDCWAFTGHCTYFTYAKCEQWKNRCAAKMKCPQLREYPSTFGCGACAKNFIDKRRVFTSIPFERMTLITPSSWLADLVEESYFASYPVETRHNTIDACIFKPTPSDFRKRNAIGNRFLILGVASPWSERKGLCDFIELSKELDLQKFAIALVGLSGKQIKNLPEGIVGLGCTNSREELAGIYTAADALFNPTREDNYPSTLLEAQACGTPVVTYDVGGCRETISLESSAAVSSLAEAMEVIKGLANKRECVLV